MDPRIHPPPDLLRGLARHLLELDARSSGLDAGEARAAREFFEASWLDAQRGLLKRTALIQVETPIDGARHLLRWSIDRRYLRRGPTAELEVADGPVTGTILYRFDQFRAPADEPTVLVRIDTALGFTHPNVDPASGHVCLNQLPRPCPLEILLQVLCGVVTYQTLNLSQPLDADAAARFAFPEALPALDPVEPLF